MRKPTEEEIRNDFIVFADDTVPIPKEDLTFDEETERRRLMRILKQNIIYKGKGIHLNALF